MVNTDEYNVRELTPMRRTTKDNKVYTYSVDMESWGKVVWNLSLVEIWYRLYRFAQMQGGENILVAVDHIIHRVYPYTILYDRANERHCHFTLYLYMPILHMCIETYIHYVYIDGVMMNVHV